MGKNVLEFIIHEGDLVVLHKQNALLKTVKDELTWILILLVHNIFLKWWRKLLFFLIVNQEELDDEKYSEIEGNQINTHEANESNSILI